MKDNVNNPAHYKKSDVECIDAISSALSPDEFKGYCKENLREIDNFIRYTQIIYAKLNYFDGLEKNESN